MNWETLAPLSGPRVYASSCVRNDVIYIVGGCDAMGQPVSSMEAFDVKTNAWTVLPDMPTKRAAPIVDIIQDRIIAVGGIGMDQRPVDKVEIYDFDKKKWSIQPKLSEALMGMGQLVKGGKLYIFGGMAVDTNPREHLKCVSITKQSDKDTTQWQAFPSMPTARYACKAFLHNEKAFVIGGRSGKIPVCAFEVFDFETYTWIKYPSLISRRVFQSYVLTDKFIVSLGGLKEDVQSGFSDACEIYNLDSGENGSWVTNKRMNIPTKRGDFNAVCIDNKIILVGGLGNQRRPLGSVEMFNPETKKWLRLVDCPRIHSTSTAVALHGNLYTFGGIAKDGPSGECEVLKAEIHNGS